MTYVDVFILGIVAVSMLIGYFRGFFPEAIGLASWVIALFGGWHFAASIEPYLAGKLGSAAAELWAARVIMFVLILIVGGLVGQLVSLLIDKAGLSRTDKSLGLVFGAARGVVILGVLVLVGQLMSFDRDDWWSESLLISHGEKVAGVIRGMLPDSLSQHFDGSGAPPPASALPAKEPD